jgi:hypothetical protein
MSAEVAIVAGTGGALGHAASPALAVGGRTVAAAGRNEHALRDLRAMSAARRPPRPRRTPVSPPACSTPPSRSAARSGWHCSAPSLGQPSRTASGPRSRTRRRPPRRRAGHCRSHAPPGLRPATITPWRSAFPRVRCCRGDRAARPAHRDRHHPGPPPGTVGAVPAPQEAAPQPGTVQRHEDRAAVAAAVRPCRLC